MYVRDFLNVPFHVRVRHSYVLCVLHIVNYLFIHVHGIPGIAHKTLFSLCDFNISDELQTGQLEALCQLISQTQEIIKKKELQVVLHMSSLMRMMKRVLVNRAWIPLISGIEGILKPPNRINSIMVFIHSSPALHGYHGFRKKSNRESARRSRRRKQAHLADLELQVTNFLGVQKRI